MSEGLPSVAPLPPPPERAADRRTLNTSACWLGLQRCRRLGARLVVYNTEPGYPGQPRAVARLASRVGAAEIWEYPIGVAPRWESTGAGVFRRRHGFSETLPAV
ncbi:unnamed protein product [Prorocentrum cordatum]|uniref:Uncharacterized protein n=1 Tax=Prorocentrum cordatum TaxID=2364126 RepID=A0ABN9PST5_9DINO|nr:unnamed protein product [Polarella glacialis]